MRFDAWYNRQASRKHGGLDLLAYIEHMQSDESRIPTHGTKDCFAAGAAIDKIMYFIILCGDTE
jgi:hypothetical protein